MAELIYFTAAWCSPCKAILPKVTKAAEAAGLLVRVVDIDGPDQKLAATYGVTSVPTVILPDGRPIHPATMPWSAVRKMIEEAAR